MIDAQVANALRWVKTSGGEEFERFPDFLIVGPQRTGTTWLHAHLRFHPQIFLSEPKEILLLQPPEDAAARSSSPTISAGTCASSATRCGVSPPRRPSSCGSYREFYRPRVRGEATASYAAMDRDVIAEIAALNPDIKVILMIRNPIDRAWSHAKKDLGAQPQGRSSPTCPEEEFRPSSAITTSIGARIMSRARQLVGSPRGGQSVRRRVRRDRDPSRRRSCST